MGKPVKILDLAKNMLKVYGLNENDIPIVTKKRSEKLFERDFNWTMKL